MSEEAAPYLVDAPADHCAMCCAPLRVLEHGARLVCPNFHGRWQRFYVTTAGPPTDGFEALPIVGARSGRTFYVYGART